MNCRTPLCLAALLFALTIGSPAPAAADESTPVESTGGAAISYERQVAPIFRSHCNGCHQPASAKGDYIMTDFARLLAAGESGEPAIVPGDSEASYLLNQIRPDADGHAEMPKDADPLSEAEVELIATWIDQGAENDGVESGPIYTVDNPPSYTRLPVITSIAFSPDTRMLAVAGYHEVLLLSGDGSTLLRRLVGLSERIESVAFSPDGTKLAAAGGRPGREGEVQLWNPTSGQLLRSISVGYDTVYGLSWSPDGRTVAVGCPDNVVRAFDVASGQQTLFMGSHDDWPLDTVWGLDGSQLVSVGRDMTAKLTEVATQRFIDNITSITPGALKGGMHAVARHPHHDEILVGGSDGEPKIYRLERLTKRVIGDDANLMRKLPSLPGRVFGVAYAPSGQHAAAVSSLNGTGQISVYHTRHDFALPEDMKKINEKRVFQWTQADRDRMAEYWSEDVGLDWSVPLPSGQYAVTFSPDGQRVVAAGADGTVRMFLAADGTLIAEVDPVELMDGADVMRLEAVSEARPDHTSIPRETWPADASGDVAELLVQPSRLDLADRFATVQLLITARRADGTTADVTRLATIFNRPLLQTVEVLPGGLARPLANGTETLTVAFRGHTVQVPVAVRGIAETAVSYSKHVNPTMSKLGCNQGTCHGAKDGKEGFKLSLRGYDPLYDLRALTDDHKSRRVNVAQPDDSLMLLKAGGRIPHVGGAICEPGSDAYAVLRAWVSEGAMLDEQPVRVESIAVLPQNPVLGLPGGYQQMRVVATYDDGSTRDVTADAFVSSGNMDVATCDSTALVKTLRRGEAPVLARYEGRYATTTITVMGDREGFEWKQPETWSPIDELVAAKWERMKIRPSGLCDDATFIRRVSLDLTGLPPTAADVRAFLADQSPTRRKRAELIDRLLASEEYVDFWTNKWADLLMVNRKFLGPEGAKLYHDWIEQHVAANTPYDEFVRDIVTASGSNKENPAASYWKVLREPAEAMENTTHLFLATRFNCNKCHDHPFEKWTQDQYYETAAYFAQVSRAKDGKNAGNKTIGKTAVESGTPLYEIITDAASGDVTHDRTGAITPPAFPYAAEFDESILENRDPDADGRLSRREELALWITSPDNRYFASSYVNRVWGYLLGVGLIEPLDDIRAGNPPSNPELLGYLESRFIESGFDVRQLMREICTSRTYQLDIATNKWNVDDATNYSHAYPKRLPAEVLYDTIHAVIGAQSSIPGMPAGTRALELPDAGLKLEDGFLANLGRPVRESACECERSSEMQLGSVMALVSGPTIESAISSPANELDELVARQPDDEQLIRELFLRVLSREATDDEIESGLAAFDQLRRDDQAVDRELAAYREQIREREAQRAANRERAIQSAREAVAARETTIADDRAKAEAARLANVEKLSAEYDAMRAKLPQRVEAFVAEHQSEAVAWTTMTFTALDETVSRDKSFLKQLDNGIVIAGGGKLTKRALYRLEAKLPPGQAITAFKLEALADGSLPGNGPGRGGGNFVVTEFEVKGPPADGGGYKKWDIAKAVASFEQNGYPAAEAINGQYRESGDGWAISPKQGRDHHLILQMKQPFERGEDGRLVHFHIDQRYTDRQHILGRFRLSYTTAADPFGSGLPADVAAAVRADERTPEQTAAIVAHLAETDRAVRAKELAVANARKPLPDDVELVKLRAAVKVAERPLVPDPVLVRLERAAGLSKQQIDQPRLTAAEDLVWALMNSPAFLFNH